MQQRSCLDLEPRIRLKGNFPLQETPPAPSAPEGSPPGFAPAQVSGPQLYEGSRRPDPAGQLPPGEYEPVRLRFGGCPLDHLSQLNVAQKHANNAVRSASHA